MHKMCFCLFLTVFIPLCQQTISTHFHAHPGYPSKQGNEEVQTSIKSTISSATTIPTITFTSTSVTTPKIFSIKKQTDYSNITQENTKSDFFMLKVNPDVAAIEGNGNLTCKASGTKLRKFKPYEIVWFEQSDSGTYNLIKKQTNGTLLVLDQNTLKKHKGHFVICALQLKRFSQTLTVQTKYIYLKKPTSYDDESSSSLWELQNTTETPMNNDHETVGLNLNKMVIKSVTGIACFLVIVVTAVLLYRRYHKNKRTPMPQEEPSTPSSSISQEHIYIYVPLQPVSFYEAKKMVTANVKNYPGSVEPPPVPARPKHQKPIRKDDVYVYSYAYGVNK